MTKKVHKLSDNLYQWDKAISPPQEAPESCLITPRKLDKSLFTPVSIKNPVSDKEKVLKLLGIGINRKREKKQIKYIKCFMRIFKPGQRQSRLKCFSSPEVAM